MYTVFNYFCKDKTPKFKRTNQYIVSHHFTSLFTGQLIGGYVVGGFNITQYKMAIHFNLGIKYLQKVMYFCLLLKILLKI